MRCTLGFLGSREGECGVGAPVDPLVFEKGVREFVPWSAVGVGGDRAGGGVKLCNGRRKSAEIIEDLQKRVNQHLVQVHSTYSCIQRRFLQLVFLFC